jgi:transposase InsO family protein
VEEPLPVRRPAGPGGPVQAAEVLPWQVSAEVEALVCEMRRGHPRWGPRRIRAELAKRAEFADGTCRLPHRSSIYRILVRFDLLTVKPRRRRRSEYKRWQRDAPMELWQLDIVGSCFLTDGRELKVVAGIDDHSRYCVIAAVVPRATARAVCMAFVQALREFGCPQQVLSDNGKQFTGRFGKPRAAEVLFERICRRNGIETILTKPRSPTTTGKVERFPTRPCKRTASPRTARSTTSLPLRPRSTRSGPSTTTTGPTRPSTMRPRRRGSSSFPSRSALSWAWTSPPNSSAPFPMP